MFRKAYWDANKADANYRKHGVRFDEAELVFLDVHVLVSDDLLHSFHEDRWYAIGVSFLDRVLFVSYTIRDDHPWLISARRASRAEKRRYMRGDRIHDRAEESDEAINFDDIPEMTDFSRAVRGLHYSPKMSMHRVSIADDLVPYFPDEEPVNKALRQLMKEGRTPLNIPAQPFKPNWIMRINLDEDLARLFTTDESVNSALRMLVDEGRAPKPRSK